MERDALDWRRAHRPGEATQPSGAHPRRAIRVKCITAEAAFAALAIEWNRLHDLTPSASVFNSWVWQYQWWRSYGGGQPLRVLVASQGDEVLGILPLYVQRERAFGAQVSVLRLVGTGGDTHPDDLGPVLDARHEREVARALARAAVRAPEGDLLLVTDIDPDTAFAEELELAARRARRPARVGRTERIVYIDLPASWDAYLASLSGNRRAEIRRARKRLAAAHAVRFFVWDDAARLDYATERLADLHRRRWAAAGGSESFASREYLDFHRAVIGSSLARGWLRLYCLEIDGTLVAMTYCYRFRNRVFVMQGGFDPGWAQWKPGTVLLSHAIEHAIGEGNEVFDFLRGEHRYKDHLANGSRDTVYAAILRRNLRSLAYLLRPPYIPMQRNSLRSRAARAVRRFFRLREPAA
ncbi:MAG: GNAT family N-acetyltransferase [Betaproteobacteria bacterium]|nr:GNAT family N-acetyltransferase [Betaproteobacteria bacterium]